jgi:hypothetical protein
MPKTDFKPTSWYEISDAEFFINGQHSVAASKTMSDIGVAPAIAKNF